MVISKPARQVAAVVRYLHTDGYLYVDRSEMMLVGRLRRGTVRADIDAALTRAEIVAALMLARAERSREPGDDDDDMPNFG